MAALGNRQRWGWSALGAFIVLAVAAALFRPVRGPAVATVKPVAAQQAPVKLVNLKKNEAALTDPTPLFLPTEWNAAHDPLDAKAQREPGSSFAGYPAKLRFAETDLDLEFPADVEVPTRPADALGSGKPAQIFMGLTSEGEGVTQLAARKGFVEIVSARTGERVFTQSLVEARPPGGTSWQPMEFLVAVDPMGLVGPPIVTESSRVAMVDGYFRNYLAKTLRAGERLAPGFYRICVGP